MPIDLNDFLKKQVQEIVAQGQRDYEQQLHTAHLQDVERLKRSAAMDEQQRKDFPPNS